MDETFSSIDLVTQCLADEKRTLKFKEAIEKIVQKDDIYRSRTLGVDRGYISNLETGKRNPTLSIIKYIADAPGVSVDRLLK